ncbi:ribose 5-phosphate isomerase B [Zavarzinia compransoris]|uniref:Ribose 5-phosphate isomerase B n=1 Tax=Zavarzinia compransoris TaxID=1264899 RepID=A0A317E9A1_9PROT|nr:ribose 5-phosphate isomerase B [Zavarzinia compransoris]PWR23707.1 ribose 5-phosphate isomerase B [Zavarzinia compransoris]TDP47930.1 ribose-5-phosphate isomerase [Zavarzinia compransoris]
MTVIALASDHAGVDLKSFLADELKARGLDVLDLGTNGPASVDYPDYGYALAAAVKDGRAERGVAICGSGIGISIALNRDPAIRAALCHNGLLARLSRQHNDANVLVLGARMIGLEVARDCLAAFLDTPYEGGRHAGRVSKLSCPPPAGGPAGSSC